MCSMMSRRLCWVLRLSRRATSTEAAELFDCAPQVPVTPTDFYNQINAVPEPFPGSKVMNVSIIGAPNSGKSTVGNALVGSPVFASSSRIHTTRVLAKGIAVHGPTQMILSDTPGVVAGGRLKKLRLDHAMAEDPERSITQGVDEIVVVVDASDKHRRTRIDPEIMHLLYKYHKTPTTLVINKADAVKGVGQLLHLVRMMTTGVVNGQRLAAKLHRLLEGETADEKLRRLLQEATFAATDERPAAPEALPAQRGPYDHLPAVLDNAKLRAVLAKPMHQVMRSELWAAMREQLGWPHFGAVFITSATTGVGIAALRTHLLSRAQERHWEFGPGVETDQGPRYQAMNLIRAELLNFLSHEIPYKVKLRIDVWEVSEFDCLNLGVTVLVGRENWVKLLIGPGGRTIRDITTAANQAIRDAFKRDVYLRLAVKFVKSAEK